jgi:HSP20 family protein
VPRFQPSVDVIEEDEDVRIEVEVPGMSIEDLSVTVGEDSVIVRGEKKPEETEGAGVHRRERSYGAFRRVIHLPVDVDRDKAEATFRNGVLAILLPKSHEATKKVEIKVG